MGGTEKKVLKLFFSEKKQSPPLNGILAYNRPDTPSGREGKRSKEACHAGGGRGKIDFGRCKPTRKNGRGGKRFPERQRRLWRGE